MKTFRLVTILFSFLLSAQIFAAGFGELEAQDRVPELRAQGQLLTIRVVPKDKAAKLYIVGSKVAEADLKEAKIVSVTLLKKNQNESLKFNHVGNSYEVQNVPAKKPYELSIKAEVRGQMDEMKVKVPSTKP